MSAPDVNFFTIPQADAEPRKMAYLEWGKNNPEVVVCVHGLTRNSRDFDFLAQELQQKYRIIAIDVTGRGRSDWLKDKTQYHNLTYAQDIAQMLNALGMKNINWVGTSMGGLIGMLIASGFPGLVKKLVINDIGPFIPAQALRRIAEYTGSRMNFSTYEEAERFFREIYQPWGLTNERQWRHMLQNSLIKSPDGGYKFIYDPEIGNAFRDETGKIKEMQDIDLWEVWEKISTPPLVLRGADSDILDKSTAEKMVKSKPGGKLVEYKGVGHAPSLMEDTHISEIKEWLEKPIPQL